MRRQQLKDKAAEIVTGKLFRLPVDRLLTFVMPAPRCAAGNVHGSKRFRIAVRKNPTRCVPGRRSIKRKSGRRSWVGGTAADFVVGPLSASGKPQKEKPRKRGSAGGARRCVTRAGRPCFGGPYRRWASYARLT